MNYSLNLDITKSYQIYFIKDQLQCGKNFYTSQTIDSGINITDLRFNFSYINSSKIWDNCHLDFNWSDLSQSFVNLIPN